MSVITFRRCEKIRSVQAYIGLFFLTLATFVAGNILSDSGAGIRIFGWEALLIILLGFVFIGFQREAGFPELLQRNISNRKRFLFPAFYGFLFGVADLVVFKLILHPEPYETMPPFLQPFPYSLLLYSSGAVYSEIYYRLVILTVVMYCAHLFIKPKYHNMIFWILAVATSMIEPLEQLPDGSLYLILYSLISGFLFNLLQAWYYREAGILASISMRLGHYLIWHILLGIYVQYVEL